MHHLSFSENGLNTLFRARSVINLCGYWRHFQPHMIWSCEFPFNIFNDLGQRNFNDIKQAFQSVNAVAKFFHKGLKTATDASIFPIFNLELPAIIHIFSHSKRVKQIND